MFPVIIMTFQINPTEKKRPPGEVLMVIYNSSADIQWEDDGKEGDEE